MAALIKEGMTGGQVADIIEQNFENLENKFQLLSDLFDHTKEDLNRTLDEYLALVDDAYGSIAVLVDEEDTTTDKGKIKLKDRAYEPDKFSGKGYKILRKNIVCNTETGESKNILIQDMINQPNTVYEIRYDFDLNGETINIPEGCTLKFEGGSIKGGKVFSDNKTTIIDGKPFIIDVDINDDIFWGRFWDKFGNELTYKLERFTRPFSISTNTSTKDSLIASRRCGITEYEIWISPIWDNNNKTLTLDNNSMFNAINLKNECNWYPKHIRLQNNIVRSYDVDDNNIISKDTEQYINIYINICKQIIDWIYINFPLTEKIFLDNENISTYNNENWYNAYKQLIQYANTKNLQGGFVTNIPYTYGNFNTWKTLGLKDYVNKNNILVLGCNIYPNIGGNDNIKRPALLDSESDKYYNTYLNLLLKWLYYIIQYRNYDSLYITESGISMSTYTSKYNVDGSSGGWDSTISGGIFLLKLWSKILSRYSRHISHWNIWAIGTHWYQSSDAEYIKLENKKLYNILLNF